MKKDIILAGVGGQGILSIAACIGLAAVSAGMNLKQAEVHGMSQRGGDVQSHLRISDDEIHSDLIPQGKADMIISDMIISVEPMESLRYLPMLDSDGWVITNIAPFVNISNYPSVEEIIKEIEKVPNHIAIDADKIAKEIKSVKSANMVILGAASKHVGISYEELQNGVRMLFKKKGEDVINANLRALDEGRKFAI